MTDELRSLLELEGELTLTIRVRPNAPRSVFKHVMDDGSVKLDIAAPPEEGRANAELIDFVSRQFGVPSRSVSLLSGQTSRVKVVRITAD